MPIIEKSKDTLIDGVPMILNINFDEDTAYTRSEDYEWPDGATMCICVREINDYSYKYAVYHRSKGWIAYGFDGRKFTEKSCDIYYSESWSYNELCAINENENSYFGDDNGKLTANSNHPLFRNHWYDEEGNYNFSGTCSFKEGVFYLKAILHPVYGRVRFVSENDITVLYNHAKNCDSYSNRISVPAACIDSLQFHIENDGKYYSNYVYSIAVPELKIGNYVYKYNGENVLKPGTSGCITLPTSTENSSNWTCEEYFEIVNDNEKTITLKTNEHYQLYTQKTDNEAGDGENGLNSIRSDIGLNVEVKFKINSTTYESGISGYTSRYSGLEQINYPLSYDHSSEYPMLKYQYMYFWNSRIEIYKDEGKIQSFKTYKYNDKTWNWFCPTFHIQGYNKNTEVNFTLFYSKISNF